MVEVVAEDAGATADDGVVEPNDDAIKGMFVDAVLAKCLELPMVVA